MELVNHCRSQEDWGPLRGLSIYIVPDRWDRSGRDADAVDGARQ